RPPLLVALYRLVGAGHDGVRVLGALAAALLVVTSTLLAVRLGGRKAAPWAAGIGAVLASSFAIRSVFTPAELLAAVPSSASAHAVWYAMFGFRIDSVSALVKHGLESRLSTLESPLVDSGLGVAVVLAVIGIVRLRDRPLVRVTALAWMAAAAAGILLGGSYWP